MDYSLQRQKLYKELPWMTEKMQLDGPLLDALGQIYSSSMDTIRDYSEYLKKSFILIELTKTRHSCEQIIKVFLESTNEDNQKIGEQLKVINTSPGRRSFDDRVDIPLTLTKTIDAKTEASQVYPMNQDPRGRAIIINNVPDIVQSEAERFRHIFTQMLFITEVWLNITSKEIIDRLRKIKDSINQEYDEDEYEPQGLIVMMISHGSDERLMGKKACDALKIKNVIKDNDPNSAINIALTEDQIGFDEIKDVFASCNFEFDATFPRMFFFTCCREIEDIAMYSTEMCCSLKADVDASCDTVIFKSCARGYETFIEKNGLYTYFGRCLSESIAQFAYKEDLTQIMIRTISELRRRYEYTGHFAPELSIIGLKHKIFFNPGWIKTD